MMVVQTVSVVGTGLIGASWALHFLVRGLDVVACDPSEGAQSRLRTFVEKHWDQAAKLGLHPCADSARLEFQVDAQRAVERADFVQENGPERVDLKRELFARLDDAAPAHAILASSSSGLMPSQVQDLCRRPERVLVGHPFNPPHLIPLVEVVGGRQTSPDAIASAISFYRSVGKKPIHVRKEVTAHVANRLQAAVWREAYGLVQDGVADVTDIDAAMSHGVGLRWALLGPFAIQMLAGGSGGMRHSLDHIGASLDDWWQDLHQTRMTPELKQLILDRADRLLPGLDVAAVTEDRDQLLVELITAKAGRQELS
jgi:carnitine 3-dehydrogenase